MPPNLLWLMSVSNTNFCQSVTKLLWITAYMSVCETSPLCAMCRVLSFHHLLFHWLWYQQPRPSIYTVSCTLCFPSTFISKYSFIIRCSNIICCVLCHINHRCQLFNKNSELYHVFILFSIKWIFALLLFKVNLSYHRLA